MDSRNQALPPRQQLVAPGKWPLVGELSSAAPPDVWRVAVSGLVAHPLDLAVAELRRFPVVERSIDIHCVTRWSRPGARFTGVRLADVLAVARPGADARFVSFLAHSERGHSTSLPLADALDLEPLLVWDYEGQPLAPGHGGPLRVIVPGRYFYKSLKWLRQIELLADDRLGYWEREAGYHNTGDPWLEQRFLAGQLSRQEVQRLLASRDYSGRDLRGIDARHHDLAGLNAEGALLRDANFDDSRLSRANFNGANLSNAHLVRAALDGASFVGADVEGADFSGADLRGVDFTDAALLGVSFFTAAQNHDSAPLAAIIDATTKLPPNVSQMLLPEQAEFVRRQLRATEARD